MVVKMQRNWYIFGGNIKWYSHSVKKKKIVSFLKNLKMQVLSELSVELQGIYPREVKTHLLTKQCMWNFFLCVCTVCGKKMQNVKFTILNMFECTTQYP